MLGLALDRKLLSHQRLFSVFWASEWLFYDSYHRQSQVNEKSDFYHENQKLTYSLTCLCDTIVDYLLCVCVCSYKLQIVSVFHWKVECERHARSTLLEFEWSGTERLGGREDGWNRNKLWYSVVWCGAVMVIVA